MKAQEIRQLSVEALNTQIEDFKRELFELRFKQATGQLESTAKIKEIRKSIARIKTILKEKELDLKR